MGYLNGVPEDLGTGSEDLRRKAQEAAVAGKGKEAIRLLLKAAKLEQEATMKLKLVDEGRHGSPPDCSSRVNLLYP